MTKAKTCRQCSTQFVPFNTTDLVCSVKCAVDFVKQSNEIKQAKAWRKEKLERKKALKTKSDWLKEAQVVFNAYIRFRDRHENCISSGKAEHEIKDTYIGGKWDCGHYLTVGGFPELRFHPMNAHKQSKSDNAGSGKFSHKDKTVKERYRENLIRKIGLKNVEWLEGPHQAQHWDITDIQEIKAWYKEQLKYLKG